VILIRDFFYLVVRRFILVLGGILIIKSQPAGCLAFNLHLYQS
jgi:hypothetical protein